MRKKRPTNAYIAKVYYKQACNVSQTCKALKISRNTFYEWRNSDKELDEALKEQEGSLLDYAEGKLLSAIQDDNLTATIFFLKTKGKKRGYVEQVDQNFVKNPFEELMRETDADDDEDDDDDKPVPPREKAENEL
ncbi:MAG: hypothetical protein IJS97_04020 [Prevotella sp.]|nr:hypothetical protein [Prevotella sp.]